MKERENWGTGAYTRGGADKSLARPEGNELQRSNSGFIQHNLHEAQYAS